LSFNAEDHPLDLIKTFFDSTSASNPGIWGRIQKNFFCFVTYKWAKLVNVCPWEAFPALCDVCELGQRVEHLSKVGFWDSIQKSFFYFAL
jgi:hypothetical protein